MDTTLIKFVEENETALDYDPSDVQMRFVDIDDLKWNDELAEFHKIEQYGKNTIFNPKAITGLS